MSTETDTETPATTEQALPDPLAIDEMLDAQDDIPDHDLSEFEDEDDIDEDAFEAEDEINRNPDGSINIKLKDGIQVLTNGKPDTLKTLVLRKPGAHDMRGLSYQDLNEGKSNTIKILAARISTGRRVARQHLKTLSARDEQKIFLHIILGFFGD